MDGTCAYNDCNCIRTNYRFKLKFLCNINVAK